MSRPSGKLPYAAELWRKALHVGALAIPLLIILLGKLGSIAFLLPLTLTALSADFLRARSAWLGVFIQRVFGSLMRPSELPPTGSRISVNGATWIFIAALLLVVIFPVRIAATALAVSMVGDAAAAVIGRRLGRNPWPGSNRTIEGTLAFLATGIATLSLFPSSTPWVGVAGVVCAAAAEIPGRLLNDNLRVPLTAATVMFVLQRFVLGTDMYLLRIP